MVRIDRVVTRTGDSGETSLGNGQRVRKDLLRVEAYGAVDEANAAIGMLRLHTRDNASLDPILLGAQNALFDIGADLCVPGNAGARLRVGPGLADSLDAHAALLNATLAPLESFILPGGTPGAAHAHVARTVTRRAEREIVRLAGAEEVNPEIIRALNRLSDLLFIIGRHLNDGGRADTLWTQSRPSC